MSSSNLLCKQHGCRTSEFYKIKPLLCYLLAELGNSRFENQFGCQNIDLTNTTNLYARFTTSVICNSIVQNSINACGLNSTQSMPLCADSCVSLVPSCLPFFTKSLTAITQTDYAESEAYYVSDSELCSNPSSQSIAEIRADFTDCALPAGALSPSQCIDAIDNEPENCGFGNSTIGLCYYCSAGGVNSTDTCCYNSDADSRCAGVVLPSVTSTISLPTSTSSATSTPSSSSSGSSGLSGGAIAGIVIGSLAGAALIIGLIVLCCLFIRRRKKGSQQGSIFNQPQPSRRGPLMAQTGSSYNTHQPTPQGYEVLPGGRIARMSALEGHSGDAPSRHAGVAAVGSARSRRGDNHSSSDEFGDSPESEPRAGVLRPPPTMRRTASLSSGSVLLGDDSGSNGLSSPQGMGSSQSEQLPFFKDYYSRDEIHPGDRVATLWAYQPRAADEFGLERGDMLKVVGIWDDGWATGVLIDERADEWETRHQQQRDSGVSNGSGRAREQSPPVSGEIKAFPLVCVCLPQHWKKTIEGDGSTDSASGVAQHH